MRSPPSGVCDDPMPPIPEPRDLAGAAEALRRWLDGLSVGDDEPEAGELRAWHQAHAPDVIAAALALEALALELLSRELGP